MAKNTSVLNFSLSLGHRHRHRHRHLAKSQVSSADGLLNEKEERKRKTKILEKGSNQLSLCSKPQVHVQVPKEVISLGLTA